jgi:hypothetical protein
LLDFHFKGVISRFKKLGAQLAFRAIPSLRRRKAGTCGSGNLPFRDLLNKERRFIPLRLDDYTA